VVYATDGHHASYYAPGPPTEFCDTHRKLPG
jgi:hypothetical protein